MNWNIWIVVFFVVAGLVWVSAVLLGAWLFWMLVEWFLERLRGTYDRCRTAQRGRRPLPQSLGG